MVASGPVAAIVSSSAGTVWRLGPGEAAFRPAATTNTAMAEAEGAASLIFINVEAGSGTGTFAPGAGARDVDLVRAQLAPASSLTVHAEVSANVYVTSGEVATDDTTIASGASTVSDGDVVLTNSGTEVATVLVATIGRPVDLSGIGSQPDEAPPVSDGSASPPASTPPPPPATAAPTTAASATADVDQDGLTGADEELRGTDPNSSDTDADGLTDGFEVFESGTNPTVADGDGDGASDGQEVDAGTNPNLDEDSDGDGVPDADEILSGGDPFDPNDQP